jgi:rRNA-processing protein FCF1
VRVRWSPPGIEADDVLLELVETLPVHRPVVVVTNDRRVRTGARVRGANVLSSDQLLVLLGQRPGVA